MKTDNYNYFPFFLINLIIYSFSIFLILDENLNLNRQKKKKEVGLEHTDETEREIIIYIFGWFLLIITLIFFLMIILDIYKIKKGKQDKSQSL